MSVSIRRLLDQGGRGGVFFLHGEDEFRKDEVARALVDAHVDPATRDFNLDLLRGGEVDVERLASILATPPMMAEWRVVLLRETEAMAGSPRARELLVATAAAPPPGLALVLTATKPRGSSARFYSDLERRARSLEFAAMSPDDVPGWLLERCRDVHDASLEEDAALALSAAVGTDLGVLARELEKLVAFVPEGEAISVAAVAAAGVRLPTQDRWQWFDLVGQRRFDQAHRTLSVLLGQGESGVGLVIQLATQLLRIGLVVEGGRQALEASLPRHQAWLARRIVPQARGWTSAEVAGALAGLLRADRLLKASGASDEAILEEWLLGLMARTRTAA